MKNAREKWSSKVQKKLGPLYSMKKIPGPLNLMMKFQGPQQKLNKTV